MSQVHREFFIKIYNVKFTETFNYIFKYELYNSYSLAYALKSYSKYQKIINAIEFIIITIAFIYNINNLNYLYLIKSQKFPLL